jgi:hypothetical protein
MLEALSLSLSPEIVGTGTEVRGPIRHFLTTFQEQHHDPHRHRASPTSTAVQYHKCGNVLLFCHNWHTRQSAVRI